MAGPWYLHRERRKRVPAAARAPPSAACPRREHLRERTSRLAGEIQLALHDGRERRRRPFQVVVSHHVPEPVRLLELRAGERDAAFDLAGALGRALPQAAL